MANRKNQISDSGEQSAALTANDWSQFEAALRAFSLKIQQEQQRNKEMNGPQPIEKIGEIIQRTRKEQKVTLQVLAALSGVSLGTIQSIEKGKQSVSLENAIKILGALGKKLWIA